jgi:hypothetical protein
MERSLAGKVIHAQTDVKVERIFGRYAIIEERYRFYIFRGRKPWRVLPAYL